MSIGMAHFLALCDSSFNLTYNFCKQGLFVPFGFVNSCLYPCKFSIHKDVFVLGFGPCGVNHVFLVIVVYEL